MFTTELVWAGEVDRVGAEPHRFNALPPGVESCRSGSPDHLRDYGCAVCSVRHTR
jgi:hypothetical protein